MYKRQVWQKLAVVKTFWVLVAIVAFYAAVAGWIMYTFQNPELNYTNAGSIFDNDTLIYTGMVIATLFNYEMCIRDRKTLCRAPKKAL